MVKCPVHKLVQLHKVSENYYIVWAHIMYMHFIGLCMLVDIPKQRSESHYLQRLNNGKEYVG